MLDDQIDATIRLPRVQDAFDRDDQFAQLPLTPQPSVTSDIGELIQYDQGAEEIDAIASMETWIIPVVKVKQAKEIEKKLRESSAVEGQIATIRKLIKSSGIYALSSVAVPLISLVLAPFLTHRLSASNYGALTIINTMIGLGSGITQLGLYSAFFRAYNYDYTSAEERRAVVATVTSLLILASSFTMIGVIALSSWLAFLLLGQATMGVYIALASGVVLLQNLTLPGLAWLRAQDRPLPFSLLSISNLLVTLLGNIVLVGVLHWGIAGSIIANGSGFACIVICTFPIIIVKAGLKIRINMVKGLLAFGLPLVLNFVSYWVLQLSDRYLLSLFVSLTETARYAVVYTLGSAMSVVIMGPFSLAWPTTMFTVAKRKDATEVFKLIFRWFSLFLLFAAFGSSLVATLILYWLFPVEYHSAAPIIPFVAVSIVFYGVYYVFMAGANITRRTWLTAVFTTIAALVNIFVNLILIPLFKGMGAAESTLIAYIVLATVAYIVNQRLYPIPFEIGRFIGALFIGVALYVGSSYLAQSQGLLLVCVVYVVALAIYAGCLVLIAKLPQRGKTVNQGSKVHVKQA